MKTAKLLSRLRFETLNAFVDFAMADLSRAELAVWLTLFRDPKRDGMARASLDDLARRGGMNRQTASRAVGRLARGKMLQIVRRGGLSCGPLLPIRSSEPFASVWRAPPSWLSIRSSCSWRRSKVVLFSVLFAKNSLGWKAFVLFAAPI
jgi:hypothetical protein